MGVWLGGNVPVLPVQTPDGEGGHDESDGDFEQEGYGEEGTGGEEREDSRRETEEQRSGARCADRCSRGGEAEQGCEVLVESVVIGPILRDADTIDLCDLVYDTSHECTVDQRPRHVNQTLRMHTCDEMR